MNEEQRKQNLENLKREILAIINEAKNSKPEDLETIEGTNIKIKGGKLRNFRRLCDNYYELAYNQPINDKTNTVTPVYEALVKEEQERIEQNYIDEAFDFTSEVKSSLEEFQNLRKTLNSLERSYELTTRELNNLYLKRSSNPEWQQNVGKMNDDIKKYATAIENINAKVLEAKKNANTRLLKTVESQMQILINNRIATYADTESVLTADKENFVLKNDETEYNSLYILSQILKVANAKEDLNDLVVLEDSMVVTKDQQEVIVKLLPNIKIFDYIKKPNNRSPKEVNNKLIEKIQAEMAELERVGSVGTSVILVEPTKNGKRLYPPYDEEYNKLIDALGYLNRANASDRTLAPVYGGRAYILGEEVMPFESLMKSIKLGEDLNPDKAKIEHNNKLIEELYAYLDELANKVTKKQGVANLPIKSTKTINNRAWVVVVDEDNDLEEANRIIDIIDLLQKQTNNLSDVLGIAYVNYEYEEKFKQLMSKTKRFGNVIKINPVNEEEIVKVKAQIQSLIDKATNPENRKLAENGIVLETDLPLYNLLTEKLNYLDEAKGRDDLESINGIQIASEHAPRYKEIEEEIKKLLTPVKTPNELEIDKINNRIKELEAKDSLTDIETQELALLKEKLDILNKSANSKNLKDIKGLQIDNDLAPRYLEIEDELQKLLKPPAKTPNEIEIRRISERIIELERKDSLSKDGLTDIEEKELRLIQEKLDILNKSANATELEDINGIQIAKDLAPRYKGIEEEIKKLVEPQKTPNELEIEKVKARMEELEERSKNKRGKMAANGKVLKRYENEYQALENKLKLLEEAKTSQNLQDIGNGVLIDKDHTEAYTVANNITKRKEKKKIINITSLKDKFMNNKIGQNIAKLNQKETIKFLKPYLIIGLGITATAMTLPYLLPSLIYLSSAAGLNGVASTLALTTGHTVAYWSNGLATSAALKGTMMALTKVGVIGGLSGITLHNTKQKYQDIQYMDRLTPHKEQTSTIEKLKSIGDDMRYKMFELWRKSEEFLEKTPFFKKQDEPNEEEIIQEQIGQNVSEIMDNEHISAYNDAQEQVIPEPKPSQEIEDLFDTVAPSVPISATQPSVSIDQPEATLAGDSPIVESVPKVAIPDESEILSALNNNGQQQGQPAIATPDFYHLLIDIDKFEKQYPEYKDECQKLRERIAANDLLTEVTEEFLGWKNKIQAELNKSRAQQEQQPTITAPGSDDLFNELNHNEGQAQDTMTEDERMATIDILESKIANYENKVLLAESDDDRKMYLELIKENQERIDKLKEQGRGL